MTSAWFLGAAHGVAQDDSTVRSTLDPIRSDGQDAEQQNAPDWNEFENDASGQLSGLAPRVAGSDTVDAAKYVPWWIAAASGGHNIIVDAQVASSGTAAARESAGQHGHGSMQFAQGIEPVIRDGAAYGQDYFVSNAAGANEGAGNYMAPADSDNWLMSITQTRAEKESRKAFQSSNLSAFLYQ